MDHYYKPQKPHSVAVGRDSAASDAQRLAQGPGVGLLLVAATVYLGFNAGGFFAGTTATVAFVFCALAVLGALLVARPLEGLTAALAVPLGLLAGFAVWTLVSATWSDASGRALIEFDRALLYVLVLAFFGMFFNGERRLEWGIRGFAVAAVAICGAGWLTRVAADLWPIALDVQPERLSFPLTYWNALGLLTVLGLLACAHLSSSRREERWMRIVAAAAIPLLASTLLLTFSRASLGLLPVGLLVYALVARPRRLISTLLAVSVPAAVAMVASYRADVVSSARFASADGLSQGHHLAILVVFCVLVAGGLRALMVLQLDRRLEAWSPPPLEPRRVARALAVGGLALLLLLVVAGAPGWLGDRYDSFLHGDEVGHHKDPRARLTSAGNNGRIPQWEVALDAFSASPLHGNGAGTYQLLWAQNRPYRFTVIDGHSLYIEVLGELGIVGLLLVGGALVAIGVGLARRVRGEQRQAYAAVLALGVVWAIHAGVDWDWEMPAVTLWLFALAGLGLSRPRQEWKEPAAAEYSPSRVVRVVAALAVGLLAITPAAIAISQLRLDDAVSAYHRGDCGTAIDSALGSLDALRARPDPYEVIGYCDVRLGEGMLAEEAMESAVDRDPENWETHYGLALVRAADGRNPIPELEESLRLNPRELSVQEAAAAMRGQGPAGWERQARTARLPF